MSSAGTTFAPGSVAWVKCGSHFWPCKVQSEDDLDEDMRQSIATQKKKPLIIVRFFNEDTFEYLFDTKNIYPYNCERKEEFIKKGVVKSRTKSKEGAVDGWFSKFPKDIVLSEELTGGDPYILEKDPYVERNDRPNYKEIFGSKDEPAESPKKAAGRKRKAGDSGKKDQPLPKRPIDPRFREGGSGAEHHVKIKIQPSTPYHMDLLTKQEDTLSVTPGSGSAGARPGSGAGTGGNSYTCDKCGFTATRLNVIILHNKSHSETSRFGSPAARSPMTSSTSSPLASRTSSAASTPKKKASTPSLAKAKAKAVSSPKKTESARTPRGRKPAVTMAATAASKPEAVATPKTITKSAPTPTPRSSQRASRRTAAEVTTEVKPADTPVPNKTVPKTASKTSAVKATQSEVKERKPRITKRLKAMREEEEKRKKEERSVLLGEWSDDEEDETEERKKIKEALDELSSDEEPEPNFMQDDNIQGNIYEGEREEEEEEEIEEEKIEEPVAKIAEETETKLPVPDGSSSEDANTPSKINGNKEAEGSAAGNDEFEFDINKVLEETSVPSLPTVGDLDVKKRKRKSVSFADKAKEISITTMALVQPASNLEAPFEVTDEFSEFFDPRDMPTTSPKVYSAKRILKPLPGDNAEPNGASAAPTGVTSSTEEGEGSSEMSGNDAQASQSEKGTEATQSTQSEETSHFESEVSAHQETTSSNVAEIQPVGDVADVSSTDSAFADPTITQSSVHVTAPPLVHQSIILEQTQTPASMQPPETSASSMAMADSTISGGVDHLPQTHMHMVSHDGSSGMAIGQSYVDGGQMLTDTLGHLMATGEAYMQDPNSAGIEGGVYVGGHLSQAPMQTTDQGYMMLVDSATQGASMGHMMYMDTSQMSMVGQTGYSVAQEDLKASSSEHAMPDVTYYQQGHM